MDHKKKKFLKEEGKKRMKKMAIYYGIFIIIRYIENCETERCLI